MLEAIAVLLSFTITGSVLGYYVGFATGKGTTYAKLRNEFVEIERKVRGY